MQLEAEYLDPRVVLPYREYEWSREHNRHGRKAWDAMRDEIARDGFHDAAILSYNHLTGRAMLGEGNHRVGMAHELGIAIPVVVFRSVKTFPEWPMRPLTAPGEYSMIDARGYSKFRQLMRPSEIGLPTVDRDFGREVEGMEL